MCTVSILRPRPGLPEGPALRLVNNRDERPGRATALPPSVEVDAGVSVVRPIDPVGGGTWIAVNDAGYIFTLLNGLEPDRGLAGAGEPPSRGGIVTRLASSVSIDDVIARLRAFDWQVYRPWRLVVVGGGRLIQADSGAPGRRVVVRSLPDRVMVTASSRLSPEARRRRERLFRGVVARPEVTRQDAFHEHAWPDRPDISVAMRRPEARTVSRTTIEISPTHARLSYASLVPLSDPVCTEVRLRSYDQSRHARRAFGRSEPTS
jgi:hypothetical protein